jgi:hypothetical protein
LGVHDEIYCIRAEDGPLEGAVYLIDERLEIGRASSSDVQLVTVGVSRTHAVVMRSADSYVLLDMLSTNGTWVDGAKVQRKELSPGLRFKIGDCQFVFEAFTGGADESHDPPLERIVDGRVERPTLRLGDAMGIIKKRAGLPLPASLHATGQDGRTYPGNLLADIVLYRNLRLKSRRAGELGDALHGRFTELDTALRRPPTGDDDPASQRAFGRFECNLPGKLSFEDSRTQEYQIQLLDVAVDGARTSAPTRAVDANALCWLALPLIGPKGLRTVVFTGRVVWTRDTEIGIVFSGAPSWASRNRDREEQETQPLGQIQTIKRIVGHGDDS